MFLPPYGMVITGDVQPQLYRDETVLLRLLADELLVARNVARGRERLLTLRWDRARF